MGGFQKLIKGGLWEFFKIDVVSREVKVVLG